MSNRRFFRKINGVLHKQCRGPAHDEPTWLPATEKYFYFYKTGMYRGQIYGRCRRCVNWKRIKKCPEKSGVVPIDEIRPFFIEAVNRVGLTEASRRIGMHYQNVKTIIDGNRTKVLRTSAEKVILAVMEMRKNGEVRHRDSIHFGASARGVPEKKVVNREDLYKPHGDNNTEIQRKRRT
jgi:hypothetical protein